MVQQLRLLFNEWWRSLSKKERALLVADVRNDVVDQRLLTLLIAIDAPLELFMADQTSPHDRHQTLDAEPVAEFIRNQPQYTSGAVTLRSVAGATIRSVIGAPG